MPLTFEEVLSGGSVSGTVLAEYEDEKKGRR